MMQALMTLTLAWSGYAWAHPGEHHGSAGDALLHLMSEPDHVALLIAAAVVGGLGGLMMRRRAKAARRMFKD
ncbi:hypothetical protein [Methyloversatilis universalis]|uniref:hypothetical protein n=1 Tax=Methyloversatilis universalis TaxID=378211 RepID=UPI00036ACD6C|nr:hypothetical protein [Methyloversatilis universalis]